MSEISCNVCVNSYMGYGESSCVHCLRCSEYDIGIDANRALDCPHFKNEESMLITQQTQIDQLQQNLDKAIKALEKYANTDNWMGFENDGDSELWCNEFFVQYDSDYEKLSGTTIYCAGRAARETLKEIRGEK